MRRQHDAGILQLGHDVSNRLIIPPRSSNYTVTGFCSGFCTEQVRIQISLNFIVTNLFLSLQYLPPEGIKIFANTLHTHLAGLNTIYYSYHYFKCDCFI